MRATIEQLIFIEEIEDFVSERFEGYTKEEARLYIQRNIDLYELYSSSNWASINGYD
ncbi:hypothetical protein J2Z83_003776 [Virgibacillus natechei]|uniref:BH0509 family protein n=1 Tax=Virgibacillus natechei TaxID=1216297 RepID=A0ABS4IL34_9BACI|nr:hypothetical protein [Virgibacillus natechei]MBP1971625.1 hypothetical protein [Virgibacillus natechei]UZD13048.1 hypothetical protein OLD84_00265 [Virgibacillus natechei]